MNGEMDFMILNNKVKGVQGTVDNIDTKIDSVATKENIQEVKTLIENSGGGDALESTSQEILSKIVSVSNGTGITLFPSNTDIVATKTLSKSKSVTTANKYYKIFSFIPKNTGTVRVIYSLTHEITANTYTSSSSSTNSAYLCYSNDKPLYDIAEGTSSAPVNKTTCSDTCGVGIGKPASFPVGTSTSVSGSYDIDVIQGIPTTVLLYHSSNSSFSNITTKATVNLQIAYKEVSW